MLAIFHLDHFPTYDIVITTVSLFAVSSLSNKINKIIVTRTVK